jgi:hypothetical protein
MSVGIRNARHMYVGQTTLEILQVTMFLTNKHGIQRYINPNMKLTALAR